MPLDGHLYLVNQGWRGKGTGLREGAITRPLAIPQKKNLAGLGKDRDESFPFWDHLFSAASKAIQLKCLSDDEDSTDPDATSSRTSPERTSTGILSNRRPVAGVSAIADISSIRVSRLSLIAAAKRDAAKRSLYSRFFRGPTLGPEVILEQGPSTLGNLVYSENSVVDNTEAHITTSQTTTDLKSSGVSKQKRKSRGKSDDADVKREKKKRRKEERGMVESDRPTGDTTFPSQDPNHTKNQVESDEELVDHRRLERKKKKKRKL